MGFFDKLKQGLGKTKSSIDEKINNVFSVFRKVDEELLEELEEVLVMSDICMETSVKIIDDLRVKIKKEKIEDEEDVKRALKEIMRDILDVAEPKLNLETKPSIILVIGVNGVGKTTSIGKIANNLVKQGKKVVVAAADTFRAAAEEQLNIWSERAGADIVRRDKADPASVVYEAVQKARNENYDVILIDTAGGLQNKFNLMEELKKIKTVIDKQAPESLRESILVIDANTGQTGLQQANVFTEAVNLTSVALTKLDGSAKGAIIIAIAKEMKLPVKLVGVGEKMTDLKAFDADDFINALFEG